MISAIPSLIVIPATLAAPASLNRDVLPLLQKKCQECNAPREASRALLFHHRDKFANHRGFTETERATLVGWADTTALEGIAKHAPELHPALEIPPAFERSAQGDIG